MRYISLLLLVVFPFLSGAQQRERFVVDSLLKEGYNLMPDTQRVLQLAWMSTNYVKLNPDTGVLVGKRALSLAERKNWKRGIVESCISIGRNYIQLSNYGTATEFFFKALKIAEEMNDKRLRALSLQNIGRTYMAGIAVDSGRAIKHLKEAIALFEELNDAKSIAQTSNTMASIYNNNNDFDHALPLYDRAMHIYDSLGDINGRVMILSNLGVLYGNQNRQDKSLAQYMEALEMSEKYQLPTNYLLGNIGNLILNVAIDSNTHFLNTMFNGNKKLAHRKAIEYLQRYRDTCLKYGNLHSMFSGTWDLANALEAGGEYKAALAAFKQGLKFSDSLKKFNNDLTIREQETQRELLLKSKQVELDRLAVAKKRNDRGFLIAGIVLLVIVIIFISRERRKSDKLLLNILPESIAERLKKKEHPIADHFSEASILFIDMAGFTGFSQGRDPKATVSTLNDIFTSFDALAEKHGLEKIKTIGDCYMAVAGLPVPRKDHVKAAADMALEVRNKMKGYATPDGVQINFRMGLDCGPVVAGIIGRKKFIYDLWGDAVNTASRMETTGVEGEAHCTDNFKNKLGDGYSFINRGMIEIKGKGSMQTWLLN